MILSGGVIKQSGRAANRFQRFFGRARDAPEVYRQLGGWVVGGAFSFTEFTALKQARGRGAGLRFPMKYFAASAETTIAKLSGFCRETTKQLTPRTKHRKLNLI